MPINTLEYAKILMTGLDQHVVQNATTGWMEQNAGKVIYNGGDETKIPTISTTGLKNYDRDKGYPQGAVTSKYETYKMKQDRGTKFHLDAIDVNETNFIVNATAVAKEFQERWVIPEIDAYRYSKIATIAEKATQSKDYTPATDTIMTELREGIRAVKDYVGNQAVRIVLPSDVLAVLEDSPKWQRVVSVNDFAQGRLNFKVNYIDDVPLIVVPKDRLYSAIEIKNEDDGGYAKATDAKDINFLVMADNAPIALSKTDVLRIFDPLTNQDANAWRIDYRKFHDLWILKSREKAIFANLKPRG